MAEPKVLALIPARGGSKGVPRKNIRPICGKPLIAYTIEVAHEARQLFHRVVVSTDDHEIAAVAREYGADVPFLRPAGLADDRAPMVPTVAHAIEAVEQLDRVTLDWVMLLQPTDPFRSVDDIAAAIDLARQGGCDSVISVAQVFAVHPVLMKRIEGNELKPFCIEEKEGTRRQEYAPPAYMRNGAIYLTRRSAVIDRASLWGAVIRPYVMPQERSISIDSELDFKLAEIVMSERRSRET